MVLSKTQKIIGTFFLKITDDKQSLKNTIANKKYYNYFRSTCIILLLSYIYYTFKVIFKVYIYFHFGFSFKKNRLLLIF